MLKTSFIARFVLLATTVCCLVSVSSLLAHDDSSLSSAASPGSGSGGPFASHNVVLLCHLEVAEIGGGGNSVLVNDCWGWTDSATDRKFAIVGLTNACSFIEVTDPENPLYLGKLDTAEVGQNRFWRDMKVHNDHVFIVADGSGNDQGIQVLDLSQLLTADPSSPIDFTATSHFTGFSRAHNIVINEDTGHGFAVGAWNNSGGRLFNGGLAIFDFNDPTNITPIGSFSADGYTHDAQVVTYSGPDTDYTGKEIVFASNEDTLTIVEVDQNANGTVSTSQISRRTYTGSSYAHQGWLSEDHKYFYMNDELDERDNANAGNTPIPTRTHIWNVENLDDPVYEGFYNGTENTIDHNLYVKGNFIYQANYTSGMRILQIDSADPTSLSEFGYFDTFSTDDSISFNGAWSVYPYFDFGDDDVILISDLQGGMFVVKRLPIPTVANVEINIADDQRSAVESLSLSFDGEIVFEPGAFSLVQRSTATESTFDPVAINVTEVFENGQTTATVQFDSHVRNPENALVDGNYQLTLTADLVTRDGVPMSEDFVFGDEEAHGFFSFYGDSNGNRNINVFDLLAFRQAFGTVAGQPNYNFFMDFGADGSVNVFDLLQFRIRFGQTLPFAFPEKPASKSSQASQKLISPSSLPTTTTSKLGSR